MKNWLKFSYGSWTVVNSNPPTWRHEGIVYIDPSAVTSVCSSTIFDGVSGCIIKVGNRSTYYAVQESAEHVIAQIQSAL